MDPEPSHNPADPRPPGRFRAAPLIDMGSPMPLVNLNLPADLGGLFSHPQPPTAPPSSAPPGVWMLMPIQAQLGASPGAPPPTPTATAMPSAGPTTARATPLGAVTRLFTRHGPSRAIQVGEQAKKAVQSTISDLNGTVQVHGDFLVINERFTVLVQPAVPLMGPESPYWMFRTDQRPQVDLTLGVPLADHDDPEILGYLAMPRLMMPSGWMRLSGSNLGLLSLHGHSGLGFLKDYVA